ncbi:MAG: OsmC family protein [Micrococcales bacterium]|nr:OsmC family protein [Micrococcales bacterium]
MSSTGLRSVTLRRTEAGSYAATNARGGVLDFGSGQDERFTPVELLLAAIAGCSSVDVDAATSRHAEPDTFEVTASGEKLNDDQGAHMGPISVEFTITFPDGEGAEKARAIVPRAIRLSHEKLCTVSRTVLLGADVQMRVTPGPAQDPAPDATQA